MAINQGLIESNEAYACQISELKKTIDSVKLLGTSPSSKLACGMLFDLDALELAHGFAGSIPTTGEKWGNGTDILIGSEPPVPAFGVFSTPISSGPNKELPDGLLAQDQPHLLGPWAWQVESRNLIGPEGERSNSD
jgi:hypothetical protein